MKKVCITIASLALASVLSSPVTAKTLHVGIDMSSSMRMTRDDGFAARTADYVRRKIQRLSLGDQVRLRFFGAYGSPTNYRTLDLDVTTRNRSPEVAKAVARIITAIPELVRSRRLEVQNSTNIVGHLEDEAFLCANHDTEMVLITDGVEASVYADAGELFSGAASLPEPRSRFLEGCSLTMLGVGQLEQGANPSAVQHLIRVWTDWSRLAGVRSFAALPRF